MANKFHLWDTTGITDQNLSKTTFEQGDTLKTETFNTIFREATVVSKALADIVSNQVDGDITPTITPDTFKNNFMTELKDKIGVSSVSVYSNPTTTYSFGSTVYISDTSQNIIYFNQNTILYVSILFKIADGNLSSDWFEINDTIRVTNKNESGLPNKSSIVTVWRPISFHWEHDNQFHTVYYCFDFEDRQGTENYSPAAVGLTIKNGDLPSSVTGFLCMFSAVRKIGA